MQAGATWLGSNMTLTSSALVAFGSRRAMTASSLPLRGDVVRLHHLELCAQKPGPIAGSKLCPRDACRELYDIFCNFVGSVGRRRWGVRVPRSVRQSMRARQGLRAACV